MHRRSFCGRLLGLAGLWLGFLAGRRSVAALAPRASHYFDWRECFTTDPAYKNRLITGYHNHVICDGVEVPYVIENVTGPTGWARYQDRDAAGKPVREIYELETGKTVSPPPVYQCKTPDPDGGPPVPKYGERVREKVVYGDVRFQADPLPPLSLDGLPLDSVMYNCVYKR